MCLAQGHNAVTPAGIEPRNSRFTDDLPFCQCSVCAYCVYNKARLLSDFTSIFHCQVPSTSTCTIIAIF